MAWAEITTGIDSWELFRLRPAASNQGNKMELIISHEQGCVLVTTVGTLDDAAREFFRESLHPLVGQSGTNLVVDLSQSNLINSDGIGQLVSVVTHANASDSRVIFAACSPFISEVLDRNKLNTFFEMADSVPDAILRVLG
jgi:anti-sigma B factor antagonist